MAAFVGKMVAKKIFKERVGSKVQKDDPYFDTIPATRLGFKTTKRKRKALPPGLTAEEAHILTKVKRRAYRLDMALFEFGGIKFGWGSLIGIVPAIGDVLDFLLAYIVFKNCCQVNPPLSSAVQQKMWLNLIFDFIIGLVPFLGDLADAAFKCNTRNAILLEKELRRRGSARLNAAGQSPGPDPSLPENWDPVNEEEDNLIAHSGPPPRYSSVETPSQPKAAHLARDVPGRQGFFGGQRDVDLEAGHNVIRAHSSRKSTTKPHRQEQRDCQRS